MKTLIIAEHDNSQIKSSTLHVLSAAKELNYETDIVVLGSGCQTVADTLAKTDGINKVLLADNAVYGHQLAENSAKVLADIANEYDYVLAPSSTFGKNILPRVAALLDVSVLSDVMQIVSEDTFVRPIYAGNVAATVKSHDVKKLMTIRTTAFVETKSNGAGMAAIEKVDTVEENTLSTFEGQELTVSERPELTSARIVISGGRGLKSEENFKLVEALADKLGAAVGASRAAVDAGFAPNDYQVGQTGKIVAPDLYIAIGISGAIQHLAGMKDSKVVVAINNDPDAPIFQVADYGLVGDLFQVLPAIEQALSKIAV